MTTVIVIMSVSRLCAHFLRICLLWSRPCGALQLNASATSVIAAEIALLRAVQTVLAPTTSTPRSRAYSTVETPDSSFHNLRAIHIICLTVYWHLTPATPPAEIACSVSSPVLTITSARGCHVTLSPTISPASSTAYSTVAKPCSSLISVTSQCRICIVDHRLRLPQVLL